MVSEDMRVQTPNFNVYNLKLTGMEFTTLVLVTGKYVYIILGEVMRDIVQESPRRLLPFLNVAKLYPLGAMYITYLEDDDGTKTGYCMHRLDNSEIHNCDEIADY